MENIKKLRVNAGLSQRQLAEKVGVTQQAVAAWESQRSQPALETVVLIADILGTTVDELLRGGK